MDNVILTFDRKYPLNKLAGKLSQTPLMFYPDYFKIGGSTKESSKIRECAVTIKAISSDPELFDFKVMYDQRGDECSEISYTGLLRVEIYQLLDCIVIEEKFVGSGEEFIRAYSIMRVSNHRVPVEVETYFSREVAVARMRSFKETQMKVVPVYLIKVGSNYHRVNLKPYNVREASTVFFEET